MGSAHRPTAEQIVSGVVARFHAPPCECSCDGHAVQPCGCYCSKHPVSADPREARAMAHALRTRSDYDLRCDDCGAPHNIDTVIPSAIWNAICENRPGIQPGAAGLGLPEVGALCALCIDDRLQKAGMTAEAEFYFGGAALRSRLYAESYGDMQAADEPSRSSSEDVKVEVQPIWEVADDDFGVDGMYERQIAKVRAENEKLLGDYQQLLHSNGVITDENAKLRRERDEALELLAMVALEADAVGGYIGADGQMLKQIQSFLKGPRS